MATRTKVAGVEPAVYSIGAAADLLEVSRDTVRRMVISGQIDAVKVRAQWRIPKTAIDALLTSNGKQPTKRGTPAKTAATAKRTPRKAAAAKTTKTTTRKRTR